MVELIESLLKEVAPHIDFNQGVDASKLTEALATVAANSWGGTPVGTALAALAGALVNGCELPSQLIGEALAWVRKQKTALLQEYFRTIGTLASNYKEKAPPLFAALSALANALESGADQESAVCATVRAIESWFASNPPLSEVDAVRQAIEKGFLVGLVVNSVGPLYNLQAGLKAAQHLLRM